MKSGGCQGIQGSPRHVLHGSVTRCSEKYRQLSFCQMGMSKGQRVIYLEEIIEITTYSNPNFSLCMLSEKIMKLPRFSWSLTSVGPSGPQECLCDPFPCHCTSDSAYITSNKWPPKSSQRKQSSSENTLHTHHQSTNIHTHCAAPAPLLLQWKMCP